MEEMPQSIARAVIFLHASNVARVKSGASESPAYRREGCRRGNRVSTSPRARIICFQCRRSGAGDNSGSVGMRSLRELDIVLFGATSVTGTFVVEELQRVSEGLRWGVAGRNADKLRQTLRTAATNLGLADNALDGVPVIVADTEDEASLLEMAQRTRLVLNAVGPYSFYGRSVVKACVRSGTHHIDISAEPQFMKEMEADFDDEAREKGVMVLRACGFGSIPAEMCLSYLRKHFQGDLDHVESFLKINEGPLGMKINFGTWQSIIYWLRNSSEVAAVLRDIRDGLFSRPRPPCNWRLPERGFLFQREAAEGWCLPFPSGDRYVMQQSELLRQRLFGVSPVQVSTYMRAPGFFIGLGLVFLGVVFGLLSMFSAGRWLLERCQLGNAFCSQFPGFFSAGKVQRGAPTREQVLSCSFSITMWGTGWKENLVLDSERKVGKTKHSVTIRLDGPDPAYVTTAMCMVQMAVVVLKERDKMPIKGGVLSPGVVLDGTSYLDRIQKRGIRVAVVQPRLDTPN